MTRKIKFKHIYFVYLDSISLELIYLKQNPPVVQGDTKGIQFSVSPWELGRIGDTSGLGRSMRDGVNHLLEGFNLSFLLVRRLCGFVVQIYFSWGHRQKKCLSILMCSLVKK